MLRKDEIEWSAECLVTFRKPPENNTQHPVDIQALLQKHEKVFRDLPAGRPPGRGFEHIIELEEGTQAVITTPYRHPKRYKDEIEKTIKELLELGYNQPSSSPFASSMVLVKKKDGTCECVLITEPSTRRPSKTGIPSPRLMN